MIKNAIIVGDNISPAQYSVESAARGSKELVVRSHVLSEILRNAQRWVRGYESPESEAKEYGTLYDCLLLTPSQWTQRFCVVPADAPKKPTKAQIKAKKPSPDSVTAIAWWDEWTRRNPGQSVSQADNAKVHAAVNRLKEDALISELIESSKKSVMITAEWTDQATGLTVPLKALLDIVPPSDHPVLSNSLWDLKSTRNASPHSFAGDAQRYSYHSQGALYLDLYNTATGEGRTDFGHVVQENYHPYEYRTPPPLLSQRFLDFGRQCYQAALALYCRCLTTGKWPSYERGTAWPITDCADWFLAMDTIYQPLEEPEPEEAPATETYGPN